VRKKTAAFALSAVLAVGSTAGSAPGAPEKPAGADAVKVEVGTAPPSVLAGSETEITVKLSVNPGFKLNKYPRIKLAVPTVEGLVAGGETSLGSDGPPPPDKLESNYFTSVDPLRLKLAVRPSAAPGRHDIDARLSYFYCVVASGFCAPAKVALKIPLNVR
jgi:hypothetical protein